MKSVEMKVPWAHGLHARPASKLVRLAASFSSTIQVKCNQKVANARSILGLLLLAAAVGMTVQIQADGDDEDRALQAVQEVFKSSEN